MLFVSYFSFYKFRSLNHIHSVLFLISAGGAFQISAPRSVGSEATVVWNRNNGDPDDSVFARRLLSAEVGDELSESPGSLPSGSIDVEFPVPG